MIVLIAVGFLVLCGILLFIAATFHEMGETLKQIKMTVEDMIVVDMNNAEPECARCGAECTNPVCQEAVRNR